MKILITTKTTGQGAVARALGFSASCTSGPKQAAESLGRKIFGGIPTNLSVKKDIDAWNRVWLLEVADHPDRIEMWAKYDGFGYVVKSATDANRSPLPVELMKQSHVGSTRAACENFARAHFHGKEIRIVPGNSRHEFLAFPAVTT
jgi:hypothetical protein